MASVKKMTAATMEKFRGFGKWFKGKIRRDSTRSKGKKKIMISEPSNFRKETVTVGQDDEGNPTFIKEPRVEVPVIRDVGNLLSGEGPANKNVV